MSAVPTVLATTTEPALPAEARRAPAEGGVRVLSARRRRGDHRGGPVRREDLRTRATAGSRFAILAVGAALAQLFVVVAPRRGGSSEGTLSYHTTAVFLLPAALLLAPPLAALIPIAQHVPEWLKKRQPWYIGTFNIFNYTLDDPRNARGQPVGARARRLIGNTHLRIAAGALLACVVYVLVNHSLLATMFRLGRGISVAESGLFTGEALSAELVLAALGVAVAAFWHSNPWLIPLALAPLIVINRSLAVPALKMEARIDPKTGLFNARHFATALADELTRARRFDRPLSVMMADLDLLRDINNNFGHLAGDAVLRGIADVFREELRHYDVPARFGGEEFSILLPETAPEQALEIAERIRARTRRAQVRGRDVERADPGDRLHRRRRIPGRRVERQRADPSGRPRGLPREASGPKPRARGERRVAAARETRSPPSGSPSFPSRTIRRTDARRSPADVQDAAGGRADRGGSAPHVLTRRGSRDSSRSPSGCAR